MACWSKLGPVDVTAIAEMLPAVKWPPVKGGQPNRVRLPWQALSAAAEVLRYFPGSLYDAERACLSRLVPGSTYEMHRDPQPPNWITRVHVPVVTNPAAWLMFEDEGERVHFEMGIAYTFDTLHSHCYGNDGTADRVHLILDVLTNERSNGTR